MNSTTQQIVVLNLEVDEGDNESYFRFLIQGKDVKYVTIDPGVYDADVMVFAPELLPQLPPFPAGDWNMGRIGLLPGSSKAVFVSTERKELPSVQYIWHPQAVDFLSLELVEKVTSNVHKVYMPKFQQPVIAKFARFPWEIEYLEKETWAYAKIGGHDIGPCFLGHLTKGNRTIGFLMEELTGRHAGVEDLCQCSEVVVRLHDLGFTHNDLNKFNFIVTTDGVRLLDFEGMAAEDNKEVLQEELKGLEAHLRDESGIGGIITITPGDDDSEHKSIG